MALVTFKPRDDPVIAAAGALGPPGVLVLAHEPARAEAAVGEAHVQARGGRVWLEVRSHHIEEIPLWD